MRESSQAATNAAFKRLHRQNIGTSLGVGRRSAYPNDSILASNEAPFTARPSAMQQPQDRLWGMRDFVSAMFVQRLMVATLTGGGKRWRATKVWKN